MTRLPSLLLLLLILVAGAALRLFIAITAYSATFDTGTVALMAMDIAQGSDYPLFFYGQRYFGALEAYMAAALIKIVGHHELVVAGAVIGCSLGWIIANYLLFTELFDRKAGLLAAALTSFAGYQVAWYNVASYGGYPLAFALGTLVLWLALVIRNREPVGAESWLLSGLLGLGIALGLWTHLIVAPFVLVAAGVLLPAVHRDTIKPLILVGALALLGLLPGYLVRDLYAGSDVASFQLEGKGILASASLLGKKNLPALVFWSADFYPDWMEQCARIMTWMAVGGGGIVFVGCAIRKPHRMLFVPLALLLVFLVFYLPHEMALAKAPRYIMPVFVAVMATMFAFPATVLTGRNARVYLLLPVLFFTAEICGTIAYGMEKRALKKDAVQEARTMAASAELLGCESVQLVGGYIFGHMGQKYSFYSKGRTRFVSAYDERHQPSAQASEAAEHPGFACEKAVARKVRGSFQALGVSGVRETNSVFKATITWNHPRRSVVAEGAATAALFDRDRATGLAGTCSTDRLELDLGQSRALAGWWMTSADLEQKGLPEKYRVYISNDQQAWKLVADCTTRIAVSYRSGRQVYFKGYFGMQEAVFDAEGRYLRIEIIKAHGNPTDTWRINELVLFEEAETLDRPPADGLMAWLRERGAWFVVADRWLSARVIAERGEGAAFPRFNTKYLPSQQPRDLPADETLIVAVDEGLAGETREMIGADSIVEEAQFGSYVLFECRSLPSGLHWNGHFLVR